MYTIAEITKENFKMLATKGTGFAKLNWPNYRNYLIKTSSFANLTGPTRMPLLLLAFLSILFFGSFNAQAAATYYVRAGANGANNGSDWNNAYTSLPASLQRGATYYVADGTYGGYTFNDANSGTTLITIKKATASDHGTDASWSNSYGDGQAVFKGQLTFTTSYWLFDGVKGGGPGSWEKGFGFKIDKSSSSGDSKCVRFDNNPSHITIQHVDIENSGEDKDGRADSIYTLGSDYVTIRYCWIHNANRTNFLINGSQNFTLEYSLISERHNKDGLHGEHMSVNSSGNNANHVYRFNIFRNAGGSNTGVIVIKDSTQSGWEIYGNLFYNTNHNRYGCTNGIITDTTGDSTTQVKIYNNTFLPHYFAQTGNKPVPTVSWDVSTGNEFVNNIAFDSGGIGGVTTRKYNFYDDASLANSETGGQYFSGGESAIFTNPSSYNYALKLATNAGYSSISAKYKKDMLGNTRGADGSLDRGAFEYGGGGAGISAPTPPTGLHVVSE